MKKYKFRLASVLRVRKIQEEQKKGELLRANREVALAQVQVQRRLEAFDSKVLAAGKAARNSATADFMALRELQKLAAEGVKYSVQALAERQADANIVRDEWKIEKQKVQTLERLDERRREEHRIEVDRKEAVEVDDMVVARYGRHS